MTSKQTPHTKRRTPSSGSEPVPTRAIGRNFPRFDIVAVQNGYQGYSAFLIDRDTGDTWLFDRDLKWKKIVKSNLPPKRTKKKKKLVSVDVNDD